MADDRTASWFTVLGPVRAWQGETELRLGSPQQRAVLAALLVREGAQATIGELIDAVWGSGDIPESAAQTVRTYVHRLRRVLDPGRPAAQSVIASIGDGYALTAAAGTLDLGVFKQHVADAQAAANFRDLGRAERLLREALALWHGTALAGIPGEYAETQRVYLGKLRLAALELLMTAQLELGSATEAAAELATITAEHPYDERFRELHMTALYRSGRQAEALAVYQDCQKLLANELGIDPGPALQELHEQVLRGEVPPAQHSAATARPGSGFRAGAGSPDDPSTARPVPAQLPADHRGFSGRKTELLAAVQKLDRAGVAVITGMAGVGKTTFAVHLAHRFAGRYPDGQLYLDLRGFASGAEPVAPEDALRSLLEALDVPAETIPRDLAGRAAMFRTLLSGRRILLLLDNAKNAEQVRPLLPGEATSLVLITSRDRLTSLLVTDDADLITLDVLEPAEARTFLVGKLGARRVGAEPEAAEEILRRCGRLPLAISLVAARAIVNPGFSLAAIAAELSHRDGLDAFEDLDGADVRSVFSWSYNALSPDSARLFRVMCPAPWPRYDLTGAASLAGLPVSETRRLIAELSRVNLITEERPGEFAFHDLVRAYGVEKAAAGDPQERHDALVRALNHTLYTARAAVVLLNPTRRTIPLVPLRDDVTVRPIKDRAAAWAWFAAESPMIGTCQRLAAEAGLDVYVGQLAWTVNTYLLRSGQWAEMLSVYERALAAATRLGDDYLIATASMVAGKTETWLHQYDAADQHLTRAIAGFHAAGRTTEEANAVDSLGNLRSFQGRSAEAIEQFQKAVKLSSDVSSRASALNNLANEYNTTGDYSVAVPICLQAVELWDGAGDQHGLANGWDTLGTSHRGLGHYAEAAGCYRQAFEAFRELGNRYNEARTLINYAAAVEALDDGQAALEARASAAEILRDLDHPDAVRLAGQLEPTLSR
ncbi:BTAD domain-containing putative transcriptional regulator [Kribbella lupini]|uniref:BTAD domain-containing putative transcriptional regulator n=1 Tax=Kribbella lupini TaxID=291602 RepID=A0ABP4LIG1_9ACTN